MSFYKKKGVSLVVVLLFMLIATIAGTATYKWLSSSGSSSVARLKMREAEYAASAGIESARSWMTFHGNETGALIRQYLTDKRAVSLDSVLSPMENRSEEFKVWLVGADVEKRPYTVKLLSIGYAANKSAKYSKVSIMKVDGLYRVKVPQKKGSIDFKEALFAGTATGISLDVSSGIVNGDAVFNTKAEVDDHLIVTGDLSLNSSTLIKDLHVNGSLYTCTNFEITHNACIKGRLYLNGTHTYGGDIYAENGVDMSGTGTDKAQCNTGSGGGITVEGKLTTKGDITTPRHNAGTKYIIKGDVVLNNGAKLDFPDVNDYSGYMGAQPYEVKFLGNVYLSGGINNDGFHLRYNSAPNFVLGSAGKKVYSGSQLYRVSDANGEITPATDYYSYWGNGEVTTSGPHTLYYKSQNNYYDYVTGGEALASNTFCNKANCAPTDNNGANFLHNNSFYNCTGSKNLDIGNNQHYTVGQECEIRLNNVFLQVNGEYTSSVDTSGWNTACNSEFEDQIVNEAEGNCKGPHIKDPLQFNNNLLTNPKMHSSTNKGACDGASFTVSGSSFWDTGNSISRWSLLEKCYVAAEKAGELYEDEWLLIKFPGSNQQFQNISASDLLTKKYIIIFEEYGDFSLPPTSAEANVMMYWKKGGGLYMTTNAANRNYFIYSDGDVAYNGGDGKPITGSIFLTDCHKITGVNTVVADFNETVLSELTSVAAICENDGTNKCSKASSTGSSDGPADTFTDETYDSYIIPVAPQLLLTSVSEYKSNEDELSSESADNIKPSILIMPRVVYLPRKPVGKLSDYYEILNLNGAEEEKTPEKVYCSPTGIPTTEKFSSYTDSLSKGIYTCTYNSMAYGDASFYVVVENTQGDNMKVAFASDYVEITKGMTVSVPIVVPAAEGNAQPITVDVFVTKPSDWTVSGQTAKETNSSGSVYTLSLTPSTTRQTVNVFQVSMPEEGSSGPAIFQLIPPCDGCTIGAPHILSVAAPGFMTVKRKEISDYCYRFPDDCKDETGANKYYSVMNAPSCDEFLNPDDVWVYASGTSCEPLSTAPNDQWTCNMNTAATLKKKNIPATKYCDIVIPTLDNTFSAKHDNEEGDLYASIVRKTKTLTVNVVGAKNSNSRVVIKKSTNGAALEPDADDVASICLADQQCPFTVYPGYRYFLYMEKAGDDKVSYWKCLGKDCPKEIMPSSKYELLIADDNNVTARFNDVDEHCFYEDFTPETNSKFTAFCGNDETRCIDTCATPASIGSSCKVSESAQIKAGNAKPDWVMVYNNREASCSQESWDVSRCAYNVGLLYYPTGCARKLGSTCSSKKNGTSQLAPTISNNFIMVNNAALATANDKNSSAAVILSTKNAGYNGTLTSLFTTDMSPMLNSGFIFRSNEDASEYFLLTVYGKSYTLLGEVLQTSPKIYAKLCYVRGQSTTFNTSDKCVEKELDLSTLSLGAALNAFTSSTSLTMVTTINGSSVSISLAIDRVLLKDGERSIGFDLKSDIGVTLEDENHSFVGMKLADNNFRVHDISWMSQNYAGNCWDTPKVICSFKGNYLGGIVPEDADVTPWVGYSSFLDDDKFKACKLKYYYNGCDNQNDGMGIRSWSDLYRAFACSKTLGNGLGSFWDDGATLNNDGVYYHFVQGSAGSHGYPKDTTIAGVNVSGFVKDAKVILDCSGTDVAPPSSLSASQTCGEFFVGKMEYCSENFDFLESSIHCYGGSTCSASTLQDSDGTNLRDASLVVTFENPDAVNISVVLVDESGKKTTPRQTSGSSISIEVNDVSDVDNFNPQTIKSVEFTGDGDYTVTSVQTACPYALGVSSCSAAFNGLSWTVTASVNNASSCDIIPPFSLSDLEPQTNMVCGEHSSFAFENSTLLDNLNTSTQGYTFTVRAKDGEKFVEKACVTQVVEPIGLECSVDSERRTVLQGEGVPSFNYVFDGCDQYSSGKCSYEVSLEGVATRGNTSAQGTASGASTPFNTINQPGTKLSVGSYYWRVTGPGPDSPCEASFSVVAASTDASAVCNLENNVFVASVDGDGGAWSASTYVVDAYGVVKSSEMNTVRNQTGDSYRSEITGVTLQNGDHVILVLNGNRQSGSCDYVVGGGTSSSSSAVTSSASTSTSTVPDGGNICFTDARWDTDKPNELRSDVVLTAGEYTLQHMCNPKNNWWYNCYTDGPEKKYITIGGKQYECQTNKVDATYGKSENIPEAGTKLVIPPGVTLTRIGCNGQNDRTRIPEVCKTGGSGSSGSISCWFNNSSHNWGDDGYYKFKTTCTNCSYSIKNPSGSTVASGTTSGTANQESQTVIYKMKEPGNYTIEVDGSTCSANPNLPEMKAANCSVNASSLAATESANFRADLTNCNNSECNWFLKKNGSLVSQGNYGSNMNSSITGNGTYTLHLLSEDAAEACRVEISEASPAKDCKFNNTTRTYGEQEKFKVDKLSAGIGSTWELDDPDGTSIQSGTFGYIYNSNYWETSDFYVKKDGTYTLKIDGATACAASINVTQPSATCSLDNSSIQLGSNTQFRYNISNCKNNQCGYEVKLGGTSLDHGNRSEGGNNLTVSSAGTYELWLNGTKACDATLSATGTITKPTTYNCFMDNNEYNKTISGTFTDGLYTFQMNRSCGKFQVHASGSGSYTLGGVSHNCQYSEFSQGPFTQVYVNIPNTCYISKIYISDCSNKKENIGSRKDNCPH